MNVWKCLSDETPCTALRTVSESSFDLIRASRGAAEFDCLPFLEEEVAEDEDEEEEEEFASLRFRILCTVVSSRGKRKSNRICKR